MSHYRRGDDVQTRFGESRGDESPVISWDAEMQDRWLLATHTHKKVGVGKYTQVKKTEMCK